jgi:hypothetical protein
VIRFSAGLVVVAIGVLVGGVATSKLLLVYIAIGLSVAALIALAIGVVLKREELFGEQQRTTAPAAAGASTEQPVLAGQTSIKQNGIVDPLTARVPATASAAAGEAAAGDSAAQSPFDQPGYGQAAGGYGRDVFGQPARQTPASWDVAPERPGADTPSPARHGWAFRQDSPWTLEPPAASAPAAPTSPAPTSPAPASPVPPPPVPPPVPPTVTPRREKPSPPHGESSNAPAAADYLRPDPPEVASSRAEPATPAPTSPVRDWPSWFERPARPSPDESSPEDSGTDADAPASDAAPTRAESIIAPLSSAPPEPGTTGSAESDDSWPRRSWLLDDAEETSNAAAPEDNGREEAAETVAETAATATIPARDTDAADPPAEDDPEDAPADADADADATADLTASEPDRDNSDDTSDAAEASESPAGHETSSKQVTVVPGVPRYHEQNCILIRFMADDDMQKMTVSEAAEAGCTPCRACHPDEA